MVTTLIVVLILVGLGTALGVMLVRGSGFLRPGRRGTDTSTFTIAQRVRAVGKLVGLEVRAKEIATAKTGWSWLPPIVLSQARLAMIFHFEKQYWIDLSSLTEQDITELPGGACRVRLPGLEGKLQLVELEPYDIQDGRVLGLLDVIPITAERQTELMRRAQDQASGLYQRNAAKYDAQARRSIEHQLAALLRLFGVRAEFEWPEPTQRVEPPSEPAPAPRRVRWLPLPAAM